jgi:hypothetical protein
LLERNKNNSKNVGISGKSIQKTMMTKLVKNFPMLTKCIVKWTITKLQEIFPILKNQKIEIERLASFNYLESIKESQET